MNPISLEKLKTQWLSEERYKLRTLKKRKYLHFDYRFTELTATNVGDVWDPEIVRQHSFYPFFRFIDLQKRYKKLGDIKRRIQKERPLCYAAHFDALIYSWYSYLLNVPYERMLQESGLQDNVIAYRRLGKDNIDFAKEAFDFIFSRPESIVICIDLEKFFDSLDHGLLKECWRTLYSDLNGYLPSDHYAVYKAITRYSYVDRKALFNRLGIDPKNAGKVERIDFKKFRPEITPLIRRNVPKRTHGNGIPQGAPISDVLSNLYMFNFDRTIAEALRSIGGFYRRYCDDVLLICDPSSTSNLQSLIFTEVNKLGLSLKINSTKTEIRRFLKSGDRLLCTDFYTNKPSKLQYLGIQFDGKESILRKRGYDAFMSKMARSVKSAVLASKKRGGAISKRNLYSNFTSLSSRNYLDYVRRAGRKTNSDSIKKIGLKSNSIRKVKVKILKTKKKFNITRST